VAKLKFDGEPIVPTESINNVELIKNGPKETSWRDVASEVVANLNEEGFTIKYQNKRIKSVNINLFHDQQGHQSEALLRMTAQMYGIHLTGHLTCCEGCAMSKARQKNVAKKTQTEATEPGFRLFIDKSGPFDGGLYGRQYYAAVVDDATGMGFASFFKTKPECDAWYFDGIIDPLLKKGYKIKVIRMDDAGGHETTVKEKAEERGIEVEFTGPDTPQHNGKVERRIYNNKLKAKAMLFQAGFTEKMRAKLWWLAVDYANDCSNVTATTRQDSYAYKRFYKKDSNLVHYMQPFGRLGYATI
jgi:hypothetical protein